MGASARTRSDAPRSYPLRRDGRPPLRPVRDRAPLAEGVGGRAHLGGRQRLRRPTAEVLRARDAAVPQRRAAHRAPEGLLRGRRRRALPSAHGTPGAAPDGLRRVRPARREPRDPHRPASPRVDRGGDRLLPEAVPRVGHLDRLDARVRHARAALLPLDAVDLPPAVQARPRVPQGVRGQLGPGRGDRAGQRAGDRRPRRAFRRARGGPPARAVVLPHHRLRGPPRRRPGHDRLARARQADAAQLDRALGGRRGHVPLRGARRRLPGLHDAARHAVRRDVLRARARAPGRPATRRRHSLRGRGAGVHQPGRERGPRGARRRGPAEDRRLPGPHRDQPGQRPRAARLRLRLRAHGVRHRRPHGGAGARRARLRLRGDVRAADRAGRGGRRRAALHR